MAAVPPTQSSPPRETPPADPQSASSPQPTPRLASLPSLTLPKAGGAIRGIGEKFTTNPANGTGSLTLPIATSPGRSGFGPQLTLSYDSGAGNGPVGVGWNHSSQSITRKTDKGIPRYDDERESDVFLLSGSEDLVPLLDGNGDRSWSPRMLQNVKFKIYPYLPRIEGLFARIERWVEVDSGLSHWRTISRENVTTIYGDTDQSRIYDPADRRRIFSYLISRTWDDRGNLTVYNYVPENPDRVVTSVAHEANRSDSVRRTNRYLRSIQYGADTPYFPDWSETGPETPLPTAFHFEVVFDYGDHQEAAPVPTADQVWPSRPDPFSSFRSGFEVRTYRRCKRVLMFHHFAAEAGVGNNCLVRSTDFGYSDESWPTDPRNPIYTFLESVTQAGYRRENGGYRRAALPPLEFEYSEPAIDSVVRTLEPDSAVNLPEGIDGTRFQLLDLDGEGLTGILTDLGGAFGYKRNLSPITETVLPDGSRFTRAKFGALEPVAAMPSPSRPGGATQFLDLAGDGRLDLVSFQEPTPGFFERTPEGTWEPFRAFQSLPTLDWSEPNLKFVDLTGDGLSDVLLTESGRFTLWPSTGESGFAAPFTVPAPWDESRGPAVVLADGTQTIYLADMSGDGLSDLVRIRNGEVCYWPNLGYGRFGPKVTMDSAPRFTDEERFDPRRVRLADVDGSGTTDILYLGPEGVQLCFNRSGNAWSAPRRIAVFPDADLLDSVQTSDLLGNGTSCLVWSAQLPGTGSRPLRYVDLMGGKKPHLLVRCRNNLGAETRVRYAPSTRFYLEDQRDGHPWVTRLPFPVQVVEQVEAYDWIGRSRLVNRYRYHHGYFDGVEREFRGFGMVEQLDTEEHRGDTNFPGEEALNWDERSWCPPVRTKTWFHNGAFIEAGAVSKQYQSEYWHEPALRPAAREADRQAMEIADSVLPAGLSGEELRQAYRALKGMVLRTEVYADDPTPRTDRPYTVTEHNYEIEQLQRQGKSRHAVFYAHQREEITFHYERQIDDPRVVHDLTLEVDSFGNPKRRMSIAYNRRPGANPEPTLSSQFRDMLAYDQARLRISAIEQRYTRALADPALFPDDRRTPLPSETITAEVTGLKPASNRMGITNLFRFDELDQQWPTLWDGNHDIPHEEIALSDVDGAGAQPSAATRRIVQRERNLYRKNDLTDLLGVGDVETMALAGEVYRLAFTPGIISRIYGALLTPATLAEGGFVQLAGSTDWWEPSGRLFYSAGDQDNPVTERTQARAHFFLPRRLVDPFGATARVSQAPYDMLVNQSEDQVGNVTVALNDYRVLAPRMVTDPNGNRGEVVFDALGLIAGTAVKGKVTESLGDDLTGFTADLDPAIITAHLTDPLADPAAILGDATSRIVYDLSAYFRTRNGANPAPPVVYTLARETHAADPLPPQGERYQHTFGYSDGFAREIQRKVHAERGPIVEGGPDVTRWIGSGWTIYNNKGKPVRQYEPFFSTNHQFEFGFTAGVSSVMFYDPVDRKVATLRPDDTWEKVVFDVWRQESWDANDTVGITDPRTDEHVGDHFARLLGPAPNAFTSWYERRKNGTFGDTPAERAAWQDAASKAKVHEGTPTVTHFDSLGRGCLVVMDNGANRRHPMRTANDMEGQPLAVFDPLGRRAVEHCVRDLAGGVGRYFAGHDMVGNSIYRNDMDGAARRIFVNVAGNTIRLWDSLSHAFRMLYDAAQRPTHLYVAAGGSAEVLFERTIYGEGRAGQNLCGRVVRQYDTGGLAFNQRYDFKGNLLASIRQLTRDRHARPDWSALATLTSDPALDAAATPLLSTGDRFASSAKWDALNRTTQLVSPHTTVMRPNVIQPSYNQANLLERVDAWLQQPNEPNVLLDPATADLGAVTGMAYNPRGQRTKIAYGNGVKTAYQYDERTFRLTSLVTMRDPAGYPGDCIKPAPAGWPGCQVQSLQYCYDPVGNATRIRDESQQTVFFQNRRVEPSNDYTYDALYRLTSASGREHLGQTGGHLNAPVQVDNNDGVRIARPQPGDGNLVASYTEQYEYDEVSNLLSVTHDANASRWVRRYAYLERSRIDSTEAGNRLSTTSRPGDPAGGPYTNRYQHDPHGNMTQMPHLPGGLTWDELDRLRSSSRQFVNAGLPRTTYYGYDASGQRLTKITDAPAADLPSARRESERLYLGPIEIARQFAADGSITLERETLHLMAGTERIALVETRTVGVDPAPARLTRFQHSNQLSSVLLELDEQADIISYEEYFAYGSTAYQAVRSQLETPKRYRYTGKERDEETDLYYNGARYYAPWLARWTSIDPRGLVDGTNLYTYVSDNPIRFHDPAGSAKKPPANFGDMKTYNKQGAAIRDASGTRISEHEHGGARVNWEYQTTNPTTGTSAYTEANYNRSVTVTIPEDMARTKTAADLGIRDELKGNTQAGPNLAERSRPIESDIPRMIDARDATITARQQGGQSVQDLNAITNDKIVESIHLQGSELHSEGKADTSQFLGGAETQEIDKALSPLDQHVKPMSSGGVAPLGEVGQVTETIVESAPKASWLSEAKGAANSVAGALGEIAGVVGRIVTVYGAYQEAKKSYAVAHGTELDKIGLAVGTFALGIVGGAMDDAFVAATGGAGIGPETESYQQYDSGMAQHELGEMNRALDQWWEDHVVH